MPKPTAVQFAVATAALCELIPFAPQGELAQELIAQSLAEFIGSDEALRRLLRVVPMHCEKWPGVAGLRILMREDSEREYFRLESEATAARIAEYKREAKQLPQSEQQANQALLDQATKTELKRLN